MQRLTMLYVVKSSIILFINSSSFLRSFVYKISIQFQHCRLSSALYLYDIHCFSFHVCMPYSNPWIIPSTDTLHCIYFKTEFIDLFFFHSLIFFSSIFWSVIVADDDEDGNERERKKKKNNNHLVSRWSSFRYCFTYFTSYPHQCFSH